MIEQNIAAELRRDAAAAAPGSTRLFALAVGIMVLPLYAAQPLLEDIGTSLGLPLQLYGLVAMASVAGYAGGLFLLVPLTDLVELRRLVLATVSAEFLALVVTAAAPNAMLFGLAAFVVGATASAIQMLVPAAAQLAQPERRGRVIGNVMSGLMIGILLSRPLASLVAGRFGWRGVYLLDALAVSAILAALCRILPSHKPRQAQSYRVLVGSLDSLLATEPVLRRRALYQALCMASFGIFWSGVALRLAAAPFALSQTGIGLFTLSGGGGVVIAPIAGRLGDRGWGRAATAVAHGTVAVGSILAAVAGAGWLGPRPGRSSRLAFSRLPRC